MATSGVNVVACIVASSASQVRVNMVKGLDKPGETGLEDETTNIPCIVMAQRGYKAGE